MGEREVASIVWHSMGHYMDVIYVAGALDRLTGTEMYAAELALEAQLQLVSTSNGTVRWVQNPNN